MINLLSILISRCSTGVYLRWYYNGFHYFNFTNGYEINLSTQHDDNQVSNYFSRISQSEHPTKINAEYSYMITLEGISEGNIPGFIGLLLAEKVEQYESGVWREVELTRGEHSIKDGFYSIDFEITRKELPGLAEYLTSQFLYLGDTLCDIGPNELIPLNRQANDIAEMQDRQADFTTQFKIRKTRAMKLLFELSGEVGAVTTFPYENQTCKLIQNGIEVITSGRLILDKSDDNYYYVSILSGNANFFKEIENLKIGDLTLASTAHDWLSVIQKSSNENDYDYLYPLVEPSNDGASRISDDGDTIVMYGAYIWPFCKVKAIWDEIFLNAGFTDEGDILLNDTFLRLFMPVSSLNGTIENTDKYLYSLWNQHGGYLGAFPRKLTGGDVIIGDATFQSGTYVTKFAATFKYRIEIQTNEVPSPAVYLYENGVKVADFTLSDESYIYPGTDLYISFWDCTRDSAAAKNMTFYVNGSITAYSIKIISITNPSIGYGSAIASLNIYLPGLSQTEFIKMICNMFGLIPETDVWNRKVKFWNYLELYDNIPLARDWSRYLSESQGETEFKFGEYAQNNYLNYKESDDVLKNQGRGNFQVDDNTLINEKDVVQLPVSTCDEIQVLTDVDISRIDFNTYNPDTGLYEQNETIDPRIVYVKNTRYVGSPLYEKAFTFRSPTAVPYTVTTPRIASSLEIAMSSLIDNYSGLSRLLTETNYCKLKFNLPVYEVANLKHYIPVYIEQYKAYFYVNKVNNYIPGKLCTVDLIKL